MEIFVCAGLADITGNGGYRRYLEDTHMRKTILTVVITTLVLGPLSTSLAFAHGPGGPQWDDGPRGQEHGRWDGGPRGDRGPGPGDYRDHGPRPDRGRYDDRRDHFAWRGYDFRPGRPMPPHFRDDRYWVSDWRGYGLPSPPPGHRWSYIDGNYVLIAVATGVITSIILNNAFR